MNGLMKKRLVLGPKNKHLNVWAKNGWIDYKKIVLGPKMEKNSKKGESFGAKNGRVD